MSSRLASAGLAVLLAGCGAGSTSTLGTTGAGTTPPAPSLAPPGTHIAGDEPLTADQRSRVLALLAADPVLRQVIGATSYMVRDLVPWTDGEPLVLRGGALTVDLARPIAFRAELPGVSYPCRGRGRTETRTTVHATDVRSLMVDVDLLEQRVALVYPDPVTGAHVLESTAGYAQSCGD